MALHSEALLMTGGGEDGYQVMDRDLNAAVQDLRRHGSVDLTPGMAILSLVGKQMKNMLTIAGQMFSILGKKGIHAEMISQGLSSQIYDISGR